MNIRTIQPVLIRNARAQSIMRETPSTIHFKFKKAADISRMLKNSEEVLADAKREYEETEAIINSTAEINIPPRFRPEIPLNYIIKGFKAREFISLEQALFKCEEQMQSGMIPDNYFPLDASEATPFR